MSTGVAVAVAVVCLIPLSEMTTRVALEESLFRLIPTSSDVDPTLSTTSQSDGVPQSFSAADGTMGNSSSGGGATKPLPAQAVAWNSCVRLASVVYEGYFVAETGNVSLGKEDDDDEEDDGGDDDVGGDDVVAGFSVDGLQADAGVRNHHAPRTLPLNAVPASDLDMGDCFKLVLAQAEEVRCTNQCVML
jgi:hypothetical protein